VKQLLSRIFGWLFGGDGGSSGARSKLKRHTGRCAAKLPPFHVAFLEAHGNDSPSCGTDFPVVGGRLSNALKTARTRGKPLLVVIMEASDDPQSSRSSPDSMLWTALTGAVSRVTLREEAVTWGAWSYSSEAAQAAKRLKMAEVKASGGGTVVALLRPAQGGVLAFTVLGKYAGAQPSSRKGKGGGRRGKATSSHLSVSPKRFQAWVSSTLSRYKSELVADAKVASDRAIVQEVEQGFKSGLKADIEREEEERREAAEAAAAERAAAAEAKAKARAADLERKRRDALKEALGPEPSKKQDGHGKTLCSIAVRLPDGTRQQRRFLATDTISAIFDWLDGFFELDVEALRFKSLVAQSGDPFICNGRREAAVAGKTLLSCGFHERSVLLMAESIGDENDQAVEAD